MKAGQRNRTDLILEGSWKPGTGLEEPMALLDAPKVEPEERRRGFDWSPTLVVVALTAAVLLALAYL